MVNLGLSQKLCGYSPLSARASEIFCMSPEEDVLIISMYLSATIYLDGFLIIFILAVSYMIMG